MTGPPHCSCRPHLTRIAAAMNRIRRQLSETQGQTMTEYAVILALIVTVTLAVIPTLGTSVLNLWNQVAGAVGGP